MSFWSILHINLFYGNHNGMILLIYDKYMVCVKKLILRLFMSDHPNNMIICCEGQSSLQHGLATLCWKCELVGNQGLFWTLGLDGSRG